AAILAPLLALSLQQAMYRRPPPRIPRWESRTFFAAAFTALLATALAVPHTSGIPGGVPNGFNDKLDALPNGSAILNAYELGGWLHWRHPDVNTVIDGFTDGYSVE